MADAASIFSAIASGAPKGGLLGALPGIGNAASGVIPQSSTGGSTPMAAPKSIAAPSGGPVAPTPPTIPMSPTPQIGTTATPGAGGAMIPTTPLPAPPNTSGITPINSQDFKSVYGDDTGTLIG